ncbi:MAG: hypothetical protein Q8P12_01470, partial [bacterium]|nr:hypothetical protein [bacterium]
ASVMATAYLFFKDDIAGLVDSLLASELKDQERIAKEKTVLEFGQIFMQEGTDSPRLELTITATAYRHMDETELKLKLRGRSEEEALAQLSLIDAFKRTELSFWPFWVSVVPGNVDKLFVTVLVD